MTDDPEEQFEGPDRGRERPEQQLLQRERDHALARLDEKEIKGRLIEAFDEFVKMGYEVSMVGVQVRGAIEYRLELAPDGSGDTPIQRIVNVGERFRLDLIIDREMGLILYPRW